MKATPLFQKDEHFQCYVKGLSQLEKAALAAVVLSETDPTKENVQEFYKGLRPELQTVLNEITHE